jgi:hypothetical protein
VKFLFDNNLPQPVAGALRLLGKSVVHVRDITSLGQKPPDDLIMQYAAQVGYHVVTRDFRQLEADWFRPTLRRLEVGYFFVRATRHRKGLELEAWPLARMIVRAWDEIERFASEHTPPFIAIVKPGGGVSSY